MQDKMLELVERCEQATGPDRALDEDLACALGWKRQGFNLGSGIYDPNGNWRDEEPHFTASLDAAMTLVPEGASIDLRTGQTFPGAVAMIHPPKMRPTVTTRAATPALALCAAALRAMKDSNHE